MRHFTKRFFLILAILLVAFILYFFVGTAPYQKHVTWGVDFSQMQAENLGLDWKETYLAILSDLGAKNIKLHTQWSWVEGERDTFYFNDIDWQIAKAKAYNANVIYVVGMKTGRWPECHIPEWAKALSKQEQQEVLLRYIREVVLRYKDQKAIVYWQVENEPLFKFGECPWYDKDFLKKEVALVKSLDPEKSVIISDTGEYSLWIHAAQIGDIVGITTYRKVWVHITNSLGFYFSVPFSPGSYWVRYQIIKNFFGKEVFGVELQAEPWLEKPFFDIPLSEQEKSMNLRQFNENIDYAKKMGIDKFYLWGVEWWYWLKENQKKPEIWEEAKSLFQDGVN